MCSYIFLGGSKFLVNLIFGTKIIKVNVLDMIKYKVWCQMLPLFVQVTMDWELTNKISEKYKKSID